MTFLAVLLTALVVAAASCLFVMHFKLLRRVDPLQRDLSLTLQKLSQRASSAEDLAQHFQAQNADLLSVVMKLRAENSEIQFLREQVNAAHDRLLAVHSRAALATVSSLRPRSGSGPGVIPEDAARDNFRAYPTEDSPTDTIQIPDEAPRHPRETKVTPRPTGFEPEGYGQAEGGSGSSDVILDEKVTSLLFPA